MRNKNIFCELPVEETYESEIKSNDITFDSQVKHLVQNKKRVKRKKTGNFNDTYNSISDCISINEFSKLSIRSKSKEMNDGNQSLEKNKCSNNSTECKKLTGSNNWKSFLINTASNCKSVESDNLVLNIDVENEPKSKKSNCVAIDCEMVGIGENSKENMLARVSIVDSHGECLYDTFVRPTTTVTDYRTAVSGVRPSDLIHAERFSTVQKKVLELIRSKILVGHAVYNDLIVLKIKHPRQNIRDTSRYKKFYQIGVGGTPSLKKLTSHFLQVDIQNGEHNPIQDAQAAMQLYMLYRKEWEAEIKRKKHSTQHYAKKKPKSSHKPKRFHRNYKK